MNNRDSIKIIDKYGNTTICNILFTFENADTKNNYIVYTDNTLDDLNNKKVYANIYDPFSLNGDLLPITSKEEWDTIEQILNELNE